MTSFCNKTNNLVDWRLEQARHGHILGLANLQEFAGSYLSCSVSEKLGRYFLDHRQDIISATSYQKTAIKKILTSVLKNVLPALSLYNELKSLYKRVKHIKREHPLEVFAENMQKMFYKSSF